MKRAVYDKHFKMAAVKLAMEENMTVNQASKELSVHSNTLRRWITEYKEYGESAFPGQGNALLDVSYEMKKLIKQNEKLKLENEILKNTRPS